MARGKATRKSSTRGKRSTTKSRAGNDVDKGKRTGGQAGRRATTGGAARAQETQFEEGSQRTRRLAAKGGRASKGTSRPRKSDI